MQTSMLCDIDRLSLDDDLYESIRKYESPLKGKTIFDFLGHLSDIGNAERFAFFQREAARFCEPWNVWMLWDGWRWKRDKTNRVKRLAKNVVRSLFSVVSFVQDDAERKALANHLFRSESEHSIRACLNLARSELPNTARGS